MEAYRKWLVARFGVSLHVIVYMIIAARRCSLGVLSLRVRAWQIRVRDNNLTYQIVVLMLMCGGCGIPLRHGCTSGL